MILIPIISAVSCFMSRNKKEYTEVNVFINSNDEYWFG